MTQKNINIEYLRVLAAFAVIVIHVSGVYVLNIVDHHDYSWWVGNFYDAFSRWAVPAFVMISGALLLNERQESFLQFYSKRYYRLAFPLVFWSVFFIFIRLATNKTFHLADVAGSVLNGTPFAHLWYLYMLVGLYAITPFLRCILRVCNDLSLLSLIIILFVLAVINLFFGSEVSIFVFKFLPYLGYFLIGFYINNSEYRFSNRWLVSLFLISGLSLVGFAGCDYSINGKPSWIVLYDYLSPMVIVMAVAVFLMIHNGFFGFASLIKYSKNTFGIYLIHPVFLIAARKVNLTWSPAFAVFAIPVAAVVIFLLSDLIVRIMMKTKFGKVLLG